MLIGCFGEINETTLSEVGASILEAGRSGDDITLVISTYGGDLYVALGIYDLLEHHKKQGYKVVTIAVGPCMSSGLLVLQAGTIRAMTENSFLLSHYGEAGAESVEDVKQNDKVHKLHKNIVSKHVNVTQRTINSWYKHDTYFDSKKALEIGLVDEVISE